MRGQKFPQRVLDLFSKHLPQEELVVALYFLATDVSADRMFQVLETAAYDEDIFVEITTKLMLELNYIKYEENFRGVMVDLWNNYLSINNGNDGQVSQLDLTELMESDSVKNSSTASCSILEAIVRMPPASQQHIMTSIQNIANSGEISTITKSAGADALVPVIASPDSTEKFSHWPNWDYHSYLSFCKKNIIDCTMSTAILLGGGVGSCIGTSVFPFVGTVIGGIVGGAAAANLATGVSNNFNHTLFGQSKVMTLVDAFQFLELSPSASDVDIVSAYHRLALKYHPDNNGKTEDWDKLKRSMGIIRASREKRK